MKKLERVGVGLVKDLKFLDGFEETLSRVSIEARDENGKNALTISALKIFLEQARGATEGAPAPMIDHCQATSPYQSKYETETMKWVDEQGILKY
eukprot:15326916-Ditylum_brightwellii.AAC.1